MLLRHHSDFAAEHTAIPWQPAYEIRNALTHVYFSIDLDPVWATIQADLPAFAAAARALIREIERAPPTDDTPPAG